MVSHLEGPSAFVLIMIFLHSLFNILKLSLYLGNSFVPIKQFLFYYIVSGCPFLLASQQWWWPAICHLKWTLINWKMISHVVSKLGSWQEVCPSPLLLVAEAPQVLFQHPIHHLKLAIYLWMTGWTCFKLSTLQFKQLLPEWAHKKSVPIHHNRSWEAMQLSNIVYKGFGH